MTQRIHPFLHAAGVILAAASVAHAATITVSKGGAISTIGAGVAAAGPGDTVLVKAGVYQENVSIPAGKVGLKLKTKGKVVIEARAAGGAGAGPGIIVDSADVSITGFAIQNALSDGATLGGGTASRASSPGSKSGVATSGAASRRRCSWSTAPGRWSTTASSRGATAASTSPGIPSSSSR